MVGSSPDMARAYDLINRVAGTEATVLVTGESGTGKELVAKAIHARSPRANGPFIAINCAAMPEALLESELFGHLKGAFTDAHQSRQGVFLKATGGTLLTVITSLCDRGAAAVTAICLLAAPEGLARLDAAFPGDSVRVITGAIDDRLNDKGYIVPGLGDAGDRLFGEI